MLSSNASSYRASLLYAGVGIAFFAIVISSTRSLPSMKFHIHDNQFHFLLVTVMSTGLTFASSYVEEEQEFWYWIGTTWFISLMRSM